MNTVFHPPVVIRPLLLILCVLCGLLSQPVHAKVFKWVDENGKVHFGDRVDAGAEEIAEDISEEVTKQNIDVGSSKALQEKKSLFLGKTDEEKSLENRQRNQVNQNTAAYCQSLSKRLRIIQGRVVFVNEDGSYEDKTEVERQQEEDRVRAEWEANCQGF